MLKNTLIKSSFLKEAIEPKSTKKKNGENFVNPLGTLVFCFFLGF